MTDNTLQDSQKVLLVGNSLAVNAWNTNKIDKEKVVLKAVKSSTLLRGVRNQKSIYHQITDNKDHKLVIAVEPASLLWCPNKQGHVKYSDKIRVMYDQFEKLSGELVKEGRALVVIRSDLSLFGKEKRDEANSDLEELYKRVNKLRNIAVLKERMTVGLCKDQIHHHPEGVEKLAGIISKWVDILLEEAKTCYE